MPDRFDPDDLDDLFAPIDDPTLDITGDESLVLLPGYDQPVILPSAPGEAPLERAPDVEEDEPDSVFALDVPPVPSLEAGPGVAASRDPGAGDGDPVAPASDDASPEPEIRRSARREGRRAGYMVLGLLLVLVVVVFAGPPAARAVGRAFGAAGDTWYDWTHRLQDIADDSRSPVIVADQPAGSASGLIVATDGAGRAVSYVLLAAAPDGDTAAVLLPSGLLGIVPGYGDFPISETTIFEGVDLAELTVTNLLGVRIDDAIVVPVEVLVSVLPEEIRVDLPTPLVVIDGDEGTVVARSGDFIRTRATIADVLLTPGSGDELEWLQRQGAVWEGLLDAAGADTAIAASLATAGGSTTIRTLIETVAGDDDRTITAVPVTRVSVGAADAGFSLSTDAGEFVSQRLDHLLIRDGPRPRVELLNGNGLIGTTRVVAGQLIRRGYRIIKTDNAESFDFPTTQVVAQGRENQADAEAVIGMLGTGELLLEVRTPSGVVDITIIVGADVPAGEG